MPKRGVGGKRLGKKGSEVIMPAESEKMRNNNNNNKKI